MSRPLIATLAALAFLAAYLLGVLALSDAVMRWHWALHAAFFALAGIAWVGPIRWLMFWAAGKR